MRVPDNQVRARSPFATLLALLLLAAIAPAQETMTPEEQKRRDQLLELNPALKEQFRKLEEQGIKVRQWGQTPPAGAAEAAEPPAASGARDAAESAYRRGDYRTALEHYQALAAQGDTEASIIVGTMYQEGRGVPRDEAAAYAWYGRAADLGDPTAREIVRGMNDRDDLSEEEYRQAQEKFEDLARQYEENFHEENAHRRFEEITEESNVNTRTYER